MILHLLELLNNLHIVLGSSSPRRREILEKVLGLRVGAVEKSPFEENLDKASFKGPEEYVVATAFEKVRALIEGLEGERQKFDVLIGTDTIVAQKSPPSSPSSCLGQWSIFEKPADSEKAVEMLSTLAKNKGLDHQVLSSVVIVLDKSIVSPDAVFALDQNLFGVKQVSFPAPNESLVVFQFVVSTTVRMDPDVPLDTLLSYVASSDPLDKAGGYGIQGAAASFIEEIHGCFYNVMGFPLHAFCKVLLALSPHLLLSSSSSCPSLS